MSTDYRRQEMMAIATGREIRDGELAIFGVGLSMLAGYFAQAHHAPRVRAMTEGGVYGATPVGGLPWGIECNRLAVNAMSFTSALDALGCLVASGRCDVGIIGAAQVDRFGNVNTTGIWDGPIGASYRPPKTRLTGAGGANDIACGAKRYLIMVSHEPKRFVDRVSYITLTGLPSTAAMPGNSWVSSAAVPRRSSPPSASCGRTHRRMSFNSTPTLRFPASRKFWPIPAGI
jgi:glutaconate CoA-transferase subunit B